MPEGSSGPHGRVEWIPPVVRPNATAAIFTRLLNRLGKSPSCYGLLSPAKWILDTC